MLFVCKCLCLCMCVCDCVSVCTQSEGRAVLCDADAYTGGTCLQLSNTSDGDVCVT